MGAFFSIETEFISDIFSIFSEIPSILISNSEISKNWINCDMKLLFMALKIICLRIVFFIPDKLDWLDEKKIVLKEFSSEHSDSYRANNVLDYTRTYWLSTPGLTTDQWLVFDFVKEAFITKISVKVDNYECSVKDFQLQYCEGDDCKSWVTMKDFQAKCGNQNTSEQFFEGFEFRGRYMRMFCKNNWGPGGGNFILITNIKFYGALIED